jgi:hypothetical protein
MHVFYQGYAFAIRYFCEQILAGRPVLVGGLADAWHVTRFFECLSHAQEGEVTELAPGPEWTVYRSQEYA